MSRVATSTISPIQSDFLTTATLLQLDTLKLTDHDRDIVGSDFLTYLSNGILLSHDSITETAALTVSGIDITLSSVTTSIISFLLTDSHVNRPVKITKAVLNENDTVVSQFTYFEGFMNSFTIEEQANTSEIILNCTSHWADFERTNGRRTNETSQKHEFAGDRGMDFAAVMIDDIKWGKK